MIVTYFTTYVRRAVIRADSLVHRDHFKLDKYRIPEDKRQVDGAFFGRTGRLSGGCGVVATENTQHEQDGNDAYNSTMHT